MTEQEFSDLIERYLDGSADQLERDQLENWYLRQVNINAEIEYSEDLVSKMDKALPLILSNKQFSPKAVTKATKVTRLWPRLMAAAVVAAIFSLGILLFTKSKTDNQLTNDVAPGKNGATLTLANGRKIYINDAIAGNIASESGVRISKNKDGQIIYEVTGEDNGTLTYNTLTTTRGEQSQVRLPDGTLVFLNSETSFRYPTSFAGNEKRVVSLEGEGFFDVKSDKKHPFVVKTKGQEVEVLGTQFNINSYSNQSFSKTTLIEGSVRVSANNLSKILKPDQQATASANGISIQDIEAEYEIAWKEGFFMFNNESLQSIMEKVALWYDVEIVYEDTSLKKETFIGAVSRFEHISKVLTMLGKTDVAIFKIEGKKVFISRKTK